MKNRIKLLQDFLRHHYRAEEFPALLFQYEEWARARPLAGVRILDGTPLFRNTLQKFIPLLAAGAELTVATADRIPHDPEMVNFIREIGLPHRHGCTDVGAFDVILDCGGIHAELAPQYGFVELTRSGAHRFAEAAFPVVLADDSRIKEIETCLGTGEGFLRAMEQLGHGNFAGRAVVVFGCGKVGRGAAYYAARAGADVIAVDDPARNPRVPAGVRLLDRHDRNGVRDAVRGAWCVVSATGVRNALRDFAVELAQSPALIANLGVEDEFGAALPASRVLNAKVPLNFILEEPTLLRYIDPTMALSNAAALELCEGRVLPGVHPPPAELVETYWKIVEERGVIARELAETGLF